MVKAIRLIINLVISSIVLIVAAAIFIPMLVDYKTCRAGVYGEAGSVPTLKRDPQGEVNIKGKKLKC